MLPRAHVVAVVTDTNKRDTKRIAMTKRILTIVGARPQFVKAAALSRAFSDSSDFEELIVHTGQHYDNNMSEQFFEQLQIPRPYRVLSPDRSSPNRFIGDAIVKIGDVIQSVNPDCLLVYGDTNSTLAGAIAANSAGIRLAHVEAGLRSFNRSMPEEHNRVVTDHLSEFLFCASHTSVTNLKNENVVTNSERVVTFVGDIMFDALKLFSANGEAPTSISNDKQFLLMTIHRPVNVDYQKNLARIIEYVNKCSEYLDVVWPIHPRTASKIEQFGLKIAPKVCVIEPASYLQMLYLLKNCLAVLSDSGGLQKEAFFSGKQCFVARNETEWKELVDNGYSVLLGDGLSQSLAPSEILNSTSEHPTETQLNVYGNGNTRNLILSELRKRL